MRTKLPFLLMGATAVAVAVATFVSHPQDIYGSLWFKILWGTVALATLWLLVHRKLWHRPAVFCLHLSFLVILAGGLLTSLTAKRGMMHLRQGIPTAKFIDEEGRQQDLPCLIRLDTFRIVYYPGTQAPQNYISTLTAEQRQQEISMNHIGRIHNYRLYQTSYDEDLQGSILTINYDPWGTGITYLGYLLFTLSFLASVWSRKHRTGRQAVLLALLFLPLSMQAADLPTITRAKADSLERVQVMWNDRPCPIGTMAHDFMAKVYGKTTYHGLSATQVIISWTLAPEAWNKLPLIRVKGEGYRCLNDFIDYSSPTPTLKGMGKNPQTDEKVALILMLEQGNLVETLSSEVHPLSETHVTIELLYNRLPLVVVSILLALLVAVVEWRRPNTRRTWRMVLTMLLTLHFALRWYLCGHIPLASTYDTLLFTALCLAPLMPLGCAATLMVAWLVERNPQITPLMPVLHSAWLSAHVTVIMFSYALLLASIVQRSLLRWAVSLLAIGIFLGAVWANVSWGAYWTWDPKESWALITLMVYSLPLHTESLPWFRSKTHYRIYSLVALASLLMTYFGVNFLLGGMHSYG